MTPVERPLFADSRMILSTATVLKADFRSRVKAAQLAGFDAIGLFPQVYLDARRKEKLSIADMQDILAEYRICVDEIDPLLDWMSPDISASESLMYEMADAFGARSINVAPAFAGLRGRDELSDYLAAICERAAVNGLRVDLEFLPWTSVPNLSTALALVQKIAQKNAGVMLDVWHFFRSGDSIETINNLSAQEACLITSIQVCDAHQASRPLTSIERVILFKEMLLNLRDGIRVMGASAFFALVKGVKYPHPDAQFMMTDALCSRLMPGAGDIPLPQLLQALHQALSRAGAKPAVGIEVFALSAHKTPAEELAANAMQCYLQVCQPG